ncbi:Rrf2 family transcriptional regulator [Christensenellaceae bacterium OttesenSCG-928-K19]|nr:Rrf2 family transcriptional regulator [Christensenellaceae bacterium OttesenSCG-928-K19]
MQFQLATDYAIRILSYLHHNDKELATAANMAEELGITYLYFMKIIGKLKAADIICSVQGCNGGYKLAKSAEDISLFDVVTVMEGGISINRCLQEDGFCSRGAAPHCPVHKYFSDLQSDIIKQLGQKHISEF